MLSGGSVPRADIVDWNDGEHQSDAAKDLRPPQLPKVPILGDISHPPGSDREA